MLREARECCRRDSRFRCREMRVAVYTSEIKHNHIGQMAERLVRTHPLAAVAQDMTRLRPENLQRHVRADPPSSTPTLTVVIAPDSSSSGHAAARIPPSTSSSASIADRPSSGYPEWHATPAASILTFSMPFCATHTRPSVGSPLTTTTSPRNPISFAATIPAWSVSSPHTNSTPTTPPPPSLPTPSAATSIPASSPLASTAPRPCSRPSSTRTRPPAPGTVSKCVDSSTSTSATPRAPGGSPTTLNRPPPPTAGVATAQPRARSHAAT